MESRVPSLLALAAALAFAACHSDSDDDNPPPLPIVVTGIEPDPFVSYVATPFTISGSGFTRSAMPADIVHVTFRTDDGTPFADGASAEAQVDGTVISDTEIQGTTPVTNSPGIWACTVEVADSLGSGASATPIAEYAGLTVFDIDTPEIPAGQATPVQVFGLAFQPIGGNATIRFVSTIPGAFPGPSDTLDIPGTVDVTRISGVTPVLSLAGPVPAYVTVILDQAPGTPQVTSACALTVFEPPPAVPVVVSTITSPLPLGVATPFTVTGTGFLGAGNPNVAVTFTATSGTPLFGGTAVSVSVLGTATSDTTVVGTSPTGASPTDVNAFVTVTRADSVAGTSASAIAVFSAPLETVNSFTPTVLCPNVATAFTIGGTNLPTPQTATVRFRAVNGTPFAGGSSDSADVVANITSALQIDGQSPPATSTAPFLAEVTVILQSGLELPMGIECLFGLFPQCQPQPPGLVVTTLADSGPGSLRDVVLAAPAGGIITFQPGLAGNLNILTTLVVPLSVEILGPGADVIRVSAQLHDCPVFTIQPGASATYIERLTIADSGHSGDGGGFLVQGGLTLTQCEVTDNGVAERGAGIFVASGGTLALEECTFQGNSAPDIGGAVCVDDGGAAQATGCTFDANESDKGGGGVATESQGAFSAVNCTFHANITTGGRGGGAVFVSSNSTVNLTFCTLAENSTPNRGGGVYSEGSIVAANCIFSRNSDGKGDVEVSNRHGSTSNITFSLVRVGTGSGLTNGANGNLVGTPSTPIDALLGALQPNGGPTSTMALMPGSPALDSASPTSSVPQDQRGTHRPQGPGPDMGAYEQTVVL
jgi:hypothetical protein